MIFLLFIFNLLFQENPRFNEYSTECQRFDREAEIDISELPQTDYVLDAAQRQWKKRENEFACRYFIVEWSCGSGCQMNVIFDQSNGKLVASLNTTLGCEYQPNSMLIKVNGDSQHGTNDSFYVMKEGNLVRL